MTPLIILLVIALVGFQIWKQARKRKGSGLPEQVLYERLLRKTMGDRAQAERLVELERKRMPAANRTRLIRSALDRWERDNR
jgi:hypothetical protein